MLKGRPRKYNAKTPPLMANGIPVKTRKLWRTLFRTKMPFTTFTIVYLLLAVIVVFLLRRQFMETQPRWIKKEAVLANQS